MSNETVRSESLRRREAADHAGTPTHPVLKANLLMIGVVLLLVVIAVISTGSGQ